MIPRLRPDIGLREVAAAVFRPQEVVDFETHFAALMGQEYAIAFPYGRTGQMLLLEALGLNGSEIICPAYTCVVVAHAIVYSGNVPVFVDSEADGFNMDLERAEAAITERTGAIIATSIHGYPVNLDRLSGIRDRHPNVHIIQDCAHSFAATWGGWPVQKEGVAAIFGLNISKLMTSIFGGMITTDDDALAGRLRGLRDARLQPRRGRDALRAFYLLAATMALNPLVFSLVDRLRRAGLIGRFTDYYHEEVIDMPADHLTTISRAEASVGVVQCRKYSAIIAHRRRIAAVYDEALANCENLARPPQVEGATYSHYVAQVASPVAIVARMAKKGVELGRLIDYCIPDMPAYRQYVPRGASFSRTRVLNAGAINLPLWVSEKQAQKIARRIRKIL